MARSDSLAPADDTVVLRKDPKRALVYEVEINRSQPTGLRRRSEEFLLRRAFRDSLVAPAPSDIRVMAEGDSWCNLLWPVSGYPPTFVDLIDETKGYYVNNIGWPGDTFEEIMDEKQYKQLLQSNSFAYFVFSGGGNDIVGGEALKKFLRPKSAAGSNPKPEDCIDRKKFDAALTRVGKGYRLVAKETKAWTTRTKLLIHGYDYAIPRAGGQWLGRPLADKGYAPTGALAKEIIKYLVDRFYEELEDVASEAGARVKLVNCRGACAGNWHDELHPNKRGAGKVAALFQEKMGGAPVVVA